MKKQVQRGDHAHKPQARATDVIRQCHRVTKTHENTRANKAEAKHQSTPSRHTHPGTLRCIPLKIGLSISLNATIPKTILKALPTIILTHPTFAQDTCHDIASSQTLLTHSPQPAACWTEGQGMDLAMWQRQARPKKAQGIQCGPRGKEDVKCVHSYVHVD